MPTLQPIEIQQKAKLLPFLSVGVLAFYGFYGTTWQRVLALLLGVVLATVTILFSDTGRRFVFYFRDSWRELMKVVWPTRKEAVQMTLFVFVFVFALAVFLWGVDKTFEYILYNLILGWRR